jgi:hypothetical protein
LRYAYVLAALVVAGALAASAQARAGEPESKKGTRTLAGSAFASAVLRQIEVHRDATWRLQHLMGARRTPYAGSASGTASPRYRLWVLSLWQRRVRHARKAFARPPHLTAWLCIHRREGTWTDPNAPYYGGLQMDLEFQRAYGPRLLRAKGTADHWTSLEQMWVAERAFRSGRGFHPWPNTARACGLI